MNEKQSSIRGGMPLSAFLDGELSPEQTAEIERRLEIPGEAAESLARLQGVSNLVRESMSLQLNDYEREGFDLALSRRLEEEAAQDDTSGGFGALFQSFRQISWQWRTAMVLILMLIAYVPFMTQFHQGNGIPVLDSDFSGATISTESNPEKGYEMIWVFTQEEEDEETASPIGFFPIARA